MPMSGPRMSGGKSVKGRVPRRAKRAGQALRFSASIARENRSYIGDCNRSRLLRLDPPRANKATGCQLARLMYAILMRGEAHVDKGIEHFAWQSGVIGRLDVSNSFRHLRPKRRSENLLSKKKLLKTIV